MTMAGPFFPIQIPRERLGDGGPQQDGDQKYNKRGNNSLLSSHNGGQYDHDQRPSALKAKELKDKYAFREE